MKITKRQLKKIIKEEVARVLSEEEDHYQFLDSDEVWELIDRVNQMKEDCMADTQPGGCKDRGYLTIRTWLRGAAPQLLPGLDPETLKKTISAIQIETDIAKVQ